VVRGVVIDLMDWECVVAFAVRIENKIKIESTSAFRKRLIGYKVEDGFIVVIKVKSEGLDVKSFLDDD
jgi:hypothetical protein